VVKVQVTSLSENTFFARIHFRKEGIEDMDIDARPSDAIALALRYNAPIFVHKDVYESAAIQVKENSSGEAEVEVDVEGAAPIEKPSQNPVQKLKEALQKALAGEHYEEAARIRDQLKRLQSGN
jgi:bifunctional DNase/RNase